MIFIEVNNVQNKSVLFCMNHVFSFHIFDVLTSWGLLTLEGLLLLGLTPRDSKQLAWECAFLMQTNESIPPGTSFKGPLHSGPPFLCPNHPREAPTPQSPLKLFTLANPKPVYPVSPVFFSLGSHNKMFSPSSLCLMTNPGASACAPFSWELWE